MTIRNVSNTRARSIYDTFDRVLLATCGGNIIRVHSRLQKFNRALHHLVILETPVTDMSEKTISALMADEDAQKTYVFGKSASNKDRGPQPIEVLRAYVEGYAQSAGVSINWPEEDSITTKMENESADADKAKKAADREAAKALKEAEAKKAAEKPAEVETAPAPVEEKIAAKRSGKNRGKGKKTPANEPDFVAGEGEDSMEDFAAENTEV